jgi:hypothetical protein
MGQIVLEQSRIGPDMLTEQIPEFAVQSELGADIFRRVETPSERRHHYECIATVIRDDDLPRVVAYHDDARKNPERMIAAEARMRQTATLGQGFILADPRSYPVPDTPRMRLEFLLYLDFFRHWQIKTLEIARIKTLIQSGGTLTPPEISRVFRLLLDFNQTTQAQFFISAFMPHLLRMSQEKKDDRWQNAAYALRMIGDLLLRSGQAKPSLNAYEASIALGDNAFRRGLAIRAAFAADDRDATLRHLEQYERQWQLPAALATIKTVISSSDSGEAL